ncbi:MAG: cobalamin B12-binding domain protein [Deltaproteobacteria bacterium]|nr:cobalamin B12-binding domain protein [Deltaproteobacteria bacterium]
MASQDAKGIADALLNLDMDATVNQVKSVIHGGSDISLEDAVRALTTALETIGKRFQDGEWFIGELVYAGEIAKAAMDLLTPRLAAGATRRLGTIVVGTVAGDLHDLGKNIFISYATAAGFDIVDLGVDVPVQKFIDAARKRQPLAVGMSCLLTVTAGQVGEVIAALKHAGLRDSVKVIIGGAAMTQGFAEEVGADAFAPDAVTGTETLKGWSA